MEGAIVTIDAKGCQKKVAPSIVEADYALASSTWTPTSSTWTPTSSTWTPCALLPVVHGTAHVDAPGDPRNSDREVGLARVRRVTLRPRADKKEEGLA